MGWGDVRKKKSPFTHRYNTPTPAPSVHMKPIRPPITIGNDLEDFRKIGYFKQSISQ